jgi:LysM repeat protein
MGHNYTIKTGDTLGAIARRFNTTPEAIQAANPGKIKNINNIRAGDTIYIP